MLGGAKGPSSVRALDAQENFGRDWMSPARIHHVPRLLPNEFRTDLADARRLRLRDIPEAAGAADVAARVYELQVIEYVEEFTANLERHGFSNGEDLRYSEVGVVEAWPMEEPAVGGAELATFTGQNSIRQGAACGSE